MNVTDDFPDWRTHDGFIFNPSVHVDGNQSILTSGYGQTANGSSATEALDPCGRLERATNSFGPLAASNTRHHATLPIHQAFRQGQSSFLALANASIQPDTATDISVVQPFAGLNAVEDELEHYKEEVQTLYARNTLEAVRKELNSKYHLKFSSKMYKDRIRKWGFNKNLKDGEKAAIVRKQTQRSNAGKRSEIQIRNIPNLPSRIARYRSKTHLRTDQQALAPRAPTPPDLICRTPSPHAPLRMPRELEIPELVARAIQDHICGMVDSGVWQTTERDRFLNLNDREGTVRGLCLDFSRSCGDAARCFKQEDKHKDYTHAFKLLNLSMSMAGDMIRCQDPLAWIIICRKLSSFSHSKRGRTIACSVLKHFAAVSGVFLGGGHPFKVLFDSLLHSNGAKLEQTLAFGAKISADIFAQKFGKFHEISWDSQRQNIRSIGDLNQEIDAYSNLAHEFRYTIGHDDWRYWNTCVELAEAFISAKEYQKAADIAESVLDVTAAANHKGWYCEALNTLARAQNSLCKTTLAERTIREAIRVCAKNRGWRNLTTLRCMARLGRWLKDWGRAEEAASMQKLYEKALITNFDKHRLEEEERFQRHGITDASVS